MRRYGLGCSLVFLGNLQDIMTALATKLERYRNPWQELRLQYGANKGKAYTGTTCPRFALLGTGF